MCTIFGMVDIEVRALSVLMLLTCIGIFYGIIYVAGMLEYKEYGGAIFYGIQVLCLVVCEIHFICCLPK